MLYDNIKSICKERGVSISRLEKDCGLGNATIRGWETSSPYVANLKIVADCLGVTVDELLSDQQEQGE